MNTSGVVYSISQEIEMKPSMRLKAGLIFLMTAGCGFSQQAFDMPSLPTWWGHSWGIGARDMAMGGGFSAVGGDYASLHYNPAGLGTIERGSIFGTFSMLGVSTKADFLGVQSTEKTDPMHFNALGLTYPVPTARGSLVFAFGYHRVRQFDSRLFGSKFISTPGDSVTWEHTRTEKGFMSNTSIGFAVEVAPSVTLGASAQFWGGEDNYNWLFQESDQPFNLYQFARFDSSDHIRTRFSGANLNLGVMVRSRFVQFGGTVSTPFTLRCRENWDYSDITTYDPDLNREADVVSDNGGPEYRIAMPLSLRGGAAFTGGPLLVSGDVEMIRYNQIEYKTDPSASVLTQAEANLAIQRHLRNVANLHLGCELSVPGMPLKLRAGYAIIKTPFKDAPYEKDRKVSSFGLGYDFGEQLVLDAGYAGTKWEGPADDLILKQSTDASQVFISLSYRMR
jgi:hypothetical protein